jgi:hypothetical protein
MVFLFMIQKSVTTAIEEHHALFDTEEGSSQLEGIAAMNRFAAWRGENLGRSKEADAT